MLTVGDRPVARSPGGTRDSDIRAILHQRVLREHHADPDTLVLNELGLWYGTARVDIAVVNGEIHGYEIKSDRDTFLRLPAQVSAYCRVLDRVTLVVGEQHIAGAFDVVPDWWGVMSAKVSRRWGVSIQEQRQPGTNPAIDPLALAALLWCEELITELDARGAARGMRGKSRAKMVERLAGLMPLDQLRHAVRARLKARGDWRSAEPRM